ncbi:MAG TPA: glycosyl hydrolase [Acidimicrobiales bacterium]|nr:glycosyl hydrolase [Acidimicrobiales bacterium]
MQKGTQGLYQRIRKLVKCLATASLASTTVALLLVLLQGHDLAAASVSTSQTKKTVSMHSLPTSSGGLITAGPSRKKCVELPKLPLINGAFPVASGIANFEAKTRTSVSCLLEYLNGAQTWAQWVNPDLRSPYEGVAAWITAAPQSRQLVLQVDLIPANLANQSDPLGWEQSCATGQFNAYAQQLGTNLVAGGFQNSVLRLGAEMNGPWENDFVGTTAVEQNLWATCFANEVTSLRQVTGEHFLIDWNPNACYQDIPYANYYPGNAYVDIVGLDFYDISCMTPTTPVPWTQLSNLPAGLVSFETFANEHGKPLSFPEWGLMKSPRGDDPAYIKGVGSTIARGDFAFEGYFDSGNDGTLPIGPASPLSLAEYQKWF